VKTAVRQAHLSKSTGATLTTLYGIKNCDSVKKARKWLESQNIEYQFHDFRIDGLTDKQINHWLQTLSAEQLLNKRSTTWKQLDDTLKAKLDIADLSTNNSALKLLTKTLLEHPTLIKRPVLQVSETKDTIAVGFKPDQYTELFKS
jgi:arsenate reductase